jgi:DNA invertase Pin-like site-specific DNA recombinase
MASKRRFDVVMVWAIDRLGRSLIDLLGSIQTLEACGVDLYLDQQSIDTTTPAGRLMFQVTGAFAEFERSMIRQRVNAGLKRALEQGKRLGRPKVSPAATSIPAIRLAPATSRQSCGPLARATRPFNQDP